ncbi:MAG: ion channel [Planctomycetota bacterium]
MAEKPHSRLTQAIFKDRFLFLLISILCMLVLAPVFKGFIGIRILMNIFTTFVLISGVYAVSKKMHVTITAGLLALPLITSRWTSSFVDMPYLVLVGDCFGILFFAFMVIIIISFIFRERDVTLNIIYSSIVVYLLIAVMWSFVFSVLESIHPGSFKIGKDQIEVGSSIFIYYSFVTITTLGYGDITPITAIANSFSFLEAVIGQIYLVVLVARLVGMHIAQSMNRDA